MNKRHLSALLDTLLFSNVFIACCAVAQGALTYRLLSLPADWYVLGLLGCSTLAMYNCSMILSRPLFPDQSPYRRVRWIFRHERALRGWTALALAGALYTGCHLHRYTVFLIGCLAVIGLAYHLPVVWLSGRRKWVNMRQVTGLKLIYIGVTWAISVVLLPVAEAKQMGGVVPWPAVTDMFGWVWLFVVAITIPFDIRDIYQDRAYGLRTLPVMIGERNARLLSFVLLLIQAVWIWTSAYPEEIRQALAGCSLLALLVIALPVFRRNEYYYFLLLDGLLLLQFLAVLALGR